MCGRYSLFVPPDELEARFDATVPDSYERRYNAAPSQSLPVISDASPDRFQSMEWGLVPTWAESRDDGGHINARSETLTETASFSEAALRESDRAGRCLVPADGFYEWTEQNGGKQPYRVQREDGAPFAMAGLWAEFDPATTQTGLDAFGDGTSTADSAPVRTFTIVTTEPNDLVAQLHHRMAVVLPESEETRWLDDPLSDVADLLGPHPPDPFESYPVSEAVNNPANDSPELVEPVD